MNLARIPSAEISYFPSVPAGDPPPSTVVLPKVPSRGGAVVCAWLGEADNRSGKARTANTESILSNNFDTTLDGKKNFATRETREPDDGSKE